MLCWLRLCFVRTAYCFSQLTASDPHEDGCTSSNFLGHVHGFAPCILCTAGVWSIALSRPRRRKNRIYTYSIKFPILAIQLLAPSREFSSSSHATLFGAQYRRHARQRAGSSLGATYTVSSPERFDCMLLNAIFGKCSIWQNISIAENI